MRKIHQISFLIFFFALFLVAILVTPEATAPPAGGSAAGYGGAFRSFEWWYSQRSLPYGMIPQQAYQRARAEMKILKENGSIRTVSSLEPWESLGPYNIGGRILSIAIDPRNPQVIWAGSASGGLWKSTQGGIGAGAWNYVNTGYNTLSVSAISLDPSDPDVIYIGTGEISLYFRPLIGTPGARASYGMGILKSTDAGFTWGQTALTWSFPQITAVQKIVVNPLNGSTIFAATSEGVYRSHDAGLSWSRSDSVLMAMDLAISPADTNMLIASHGSLNSSPDPGLYRTTDGGESWTRVTSGLPGSNFGRTSLSYAPSDPSIIYAGVSNASTSGMIGLYKSTDDGESWSPKSTSNYVGSQGWYNNVISVHPRDPDSLYCAGLNIYLSNDGGSSMGNISPPVVHVDHHAIAFDPADPAVVYFGTDGGIFKTTDGGTSFLSCNYGLQTTQFYPGFANAYDDSSLAIGGLQDNGTLKFTGTQYWFDILYADGGWCAIDPTDKNTLYFGYQYLNLFKSTQGGSNASPIVNGLVYGSGNANFIAPFVISPSSPNVLYAGSRNLYKTVNGGTSWFASNGSSTINGTNIACIGVSPNDPDFVIVGTGTGALGATPKFEIFSSSNGGAAWTNVTYRLEGSDSLPDRYPTDIEFDPIGNSTAYLTYSGYGTGHVFKTTDFGSSWKDISGNMPDIPHQAICVDPEANENLYAGTDLGAFHSSDDGATWEDYSSGMPAAMVLDLTVSRANGKLRASTFGNGVYQRALVREPRLALRYPNGGEILAGGRQESIIWEERFLDQIDIEYSTDNGSTWSVVASEIDAAQESYLWNVPENATSEGFIRVIGGGTSLPADTSDMAFSVVLNPDYYKGWNIVSLPLKVTDPRTETIFPSAISKAFSFQNSYLQTDSLANGAGYWVKFPEPQFVSMTGDSIFADTVALNEGWNLIGSISIDLPTAELIEIPQDIIVSGFYGYDLSYSAVDTLKPLYGYWVKSGSGGELVLRRSGPAGKKRRTTEDFSAWNTLSFSDHSGSRQTLYFSREGRSGGTGFYELPPLPPEGLFDVRFGSGRYVEVIPSGIRLPIEIQSSSDKLIAEWNIAESGVHFSLKVSGGDIIRLSGKGSAGLPAGTRSVSIGIEKETAALFSFELRQNHPNPFNPSTRISYRVAAPGRVRISVHDILGRAVETLTDEVKSPGEYTATWNAQRFPSGIYFCKISAGSFARVKKMLLVR